MRNTRAANEVDTWYREHGPALLLFGIALGGDRGRAQDALHQVFLRMLQGPDVGPRPAGDVRTYLFAAVRNAIISDARRRIREVELTTHQEPWFEGPDDDYVDRLALSRSNNCLRSNARWWYSTFGEV